MPRDQSDPIGRTPALEKGAPLSRQAPGAHGSMKPTENDDTGDDDVRKAEREAVRAFAALPPTTRLSLLKELEPGDVDELRGKVQAELEQLQRDAPALTIAVLQLREGGEEAARGERRLLTAVYEGRLGPDAFMAILRDSAYERPTVEQGLAADALADVLDLLGVRTAHDLTGHRRAVFELVVAALQSGRPTATDTQRAGVVRALRGLRQRGEKHGQTEADGVVEPAEYRNRQLAFVVENVLTKHGRALDAHGASACRLALALKCSDPRLENLTIEQVQSAFAEPRREPACIAAYLLLDAGIEPMRRDCSRAESATLIAKNIKNSR